MRERAAGTWPDVLLAIVRLIDTAEPDSRPHAIAFIADFPDFWERRQDPTRIALQTTVENANHAALEGYRILSGVNRRRVDPQKPFDLF